MHILITGSKGQLGSSIKELSKEFNNFKYFFTDKDPLDISNLQLVEKFVNDNRIDVIINCAGYTNVDGAENAFKLANKINHKAVKNLGLISKKNKIKLIHISTDYVFKGNSEIPYLETDVTMPKNNYGVSKLKGEKALLELNPKNCVIIRTSWMYSLYGENFMKTMLSLFKENESINVVSDQIGSPTNALDLGRVILGIIPKIDNKDVEVYHYSNKGMCSWYQFSKEILKNTNETCIINPVSSKMYKSKAKRPKFSILDTRKIEDTFSIQIPKWEVSLSKCLKKINSI
ncbi:dTDP-4-dehydrorhamnose reductase [Lutibacter citreus]|uniref:dTDP-4-dehydrorhamnose reductase n=1 Tax=Lutibacter citreus TaxID=2138210 RepID=UPI001FE24A26|nr:dTDP-4-dehydrorhamnose reductase [Lutibacter citreus]